LFVNRVGVTDSGFASPTNAGYLLFAERDSLPRVVDSGPPRPKAELGSWLLDELALAWFEDRS
jgi:hypothetical protein